ncbi:Alpha/Beta hydrolase protein [Penicillium daleae]|uniref:Alpha/Beta hydrolase protein n=1 Tax=Penicillium daleae TaxID=63821 RepID=A0AAD6CES0_9EURO|nr:Alpha/Beta hydrolase protein [Penicillium daleae]KAJ5460938.1 Alpha/Beta hydrolase protein [Penicillium daleae]
MERHVPGLGVVSGIVSDKFRHIEQYNGIPYGTIEARFRQAKLVTSWHGDKWDGKEYGPICPFPKMVIGHGLTQARLPPQNNYDMDEFNCLNLNITCPIGSAPQDSWPVMVWIHGGGNCVGMGSDSGYNGGPLVHFSVERDAPIVIVTINYRLGAFGFLASKEIQEDNKQAGDHGFGNYGLRDQLLAYEWIKKNIRAFGGDPSRVTAAGHSAGSIDTHILMSSGLFFKETPFHQAILQSGVSSRNVLTIERQQKRFDLITTHLKIGAEKSRTEKLQDLRDIPPDDLVKAYIALGTPVPSWQGTVDNHFLHSVSTASSLPSMKYPSTLRRLLLGDTQHEGLIFGTPIKKAGLEFAKVQLAVEQSLGRENTQRVLEAYGITKELSPQQLFVPVVQIVTDGAWSQPIEAVAKSFSNGDVFYYHLTEVNPFEGPNKDTAHHGVDLLFVFLSYQSLLSPTLASLGEIIAMHWITFINGGKPWTPYSQKSDGSSAVMLFGNNGPQKEITEAEKPNYETLRLCESLQDRFGVLEGYLRGEKL